MGFPSDHSNTTLIIGGNFNLSQYSSESKDVAVSLVFVMPLSVLHLLFTSTPLTLSLRLLFSSSSVIKNTHSITISDHTLVFICLTQKRVTPLIRSWRFNTSLFKEQDKIISKWNGQYI